MNDPQTTITLTRIELSDEEHNFCFEIKIGTLVSFALTVPVFAERNADPKQMWLSAYSLLAGILHNAAEVAAQQDWARAAEEQRLTPEERLLRGLFQDRPPNFED